MGRDEGFAVMDVSTDIANDAKFRRIQRQAPELVAACVTAYLALVAASWKAGRRVSLEEEWPTWLIPYGQYGQMVIDQLKAVRLIDAQARPTAATWRKWFEPVRDRRQAARARWARSNESRHAVTPALPRGNRAVTAARVSVPSVSVPSEDPPREDTPADVEALLDRGWPTVSPKQRLMLYEISERHGGPDWAAALIRATPPDGDTDPLEVVKGADTEWRDGQRRRVDGEDREWAATKARDRTDTARVMSRIGVPRASTAEAATKAAS